MEQNVKTLRAIPKISRFKKVAAYARVSNGKDAMLHSLGSQVSYYANLIQNHKGWAYAGVYVDEAVSGTNDKRENFLRLLEDCRQGKIDMIITKSISRFSRNTTTLLSAVRELKTIGVDVFFEEQKLHSISSDGELMLSILASYAQEEARSVSENMLWRVRNNFKKGQVFSKTILGYRIKDSKLIVVPEEADIVKKIFALYLQGYGQARIAKAINNEGINSRKGNKFSPTSIFTILRNPDYTGDLLLQKTYRANFYSKSPVRNIGQRDTYLVTNAHEAIIDKVTFSQVQSEIASREDKHPNCRVRSQHLFSSLIVCGHCGATLGRGKAGMKFVYRCPTYRQKGKDACPAKNIPEEELHRITSEVLNKVAFDRQYLENNIESIVSGPNQKLDYKLRSGTIVSKEWMVPSRKGSWTPEMKEKARKASQKQHQERKTKYDKN